MAERKQIESAIAALEAQRALLGDEVVDVALEPLRLRLAGLGGQSLKQVTVLFLDLVGSTALSRRLDPEDVQATVDRAMQRLAGLVAQHGGSVLRYAGDGLLAVFGAGESREDDADRAVHCGIAIVEEAHRQAAEILALYAYPDFDVRVGIHTGPVLLGGGVDADRGIHGVTVNIAARMEQAAPPGAVRISQDTQRHVRGRFELTVQPPLTVKGFDEPMHSYLVGRALELPARSDGRGIDGVEIAMVGRDVELAQLDAAWEAAVAERRMVVVTVVGDAGLGKSRLMMEFERRLERRAPMAVRLHGRALPYSQSVPYGLLRDMLSRHLGIQDSDTLQAAYRKLASALEPHLGSGGADQAALLGRLVGLDDSLQPHAIAAQCDARQIRDRAFHALTRYLEALSANGERPLVLLLDDLHWADDGSLDFVEHLARQRCDLPLLLICAARPAFEEGDGRWAIAQQRLVRVRLQPLSPERSRELSDTLLARLQPIPAALSDLVTRSAEGNPYFAEEMVGMLIDDGVIAADGANWHAAIDRLLQIRVPSTLAGVLQARLDTLDEPERIALQRASVIGHVFWDDALRAMAPRAPERLPGLARRDLVRGREFSAFQGAREYAFNHHMLHKVTYASVLKRDRLEQHRLVAEWLVARSGERAREYFGVIADHFEKAGDAANAVAYLRKAADDAARTYALEAAIAYFDRALALIHDSRERFDVLTARTHAVFETRDLGLQERCVQDLESAAEELDDDLLHALAASFRTTHCARTGELAAAAEAASRALAHAERSGNTAAAIRAHNQWGYALAVGGEYAAARGQAELGLAMARSAGSWTGEASALNLLGYIAHELGRYDTARRHLHGALELARDRQDRGFEFRVRCSLAGNDLRIGHNARATAELHAALEAFDGLGWREYEAQVTGRLALAAHLRGDAEEALSWIERAVALDPGAKNPDFQAWLGMLRGEVHALLGQHDAAEACLLEAEAAYRALGNPLAAIEAQAGLARLALAAGDLTLARERIGAATARIDAGWRGGIVGDALLVMWTCHRVLSALGDPRAPTYLGVAHAALQERADMLGPGDRDVFLALATHVAIGAAWGREQRSAT